MTKKKRSLRNEKLKANRASETEEQRKEILRIRHENDRARRITKKTQEGNERSSETEDHEKQLLATPRLKRSDENEWGKFLSFVIKFDDTKVYNYPQHIGYVFSFICEYSFNFTGLYFKNSFTNGSVITQ